MQYTTLNHKAWMRREDRRHNRLKGETDSVDYFALDSLLIDRVPYRQIGIALEITDNFIEDRAIYLVLHGLMEPDRPSFTTNTERHIDYSVLTSEARDRLFQHRFGKRVNERGLPNALAMRCRRIGVGGAYSMRKLEKLIAARLEGNGYYVCVRLAGIAKERYRIRQKIPGAKKVLDRALEVVDYDKPETEFDRHLEFTPEQVDQMLYMWDKGDKRDDIASHFGISVSSLYNHMRVFKPKRDLLNCLTNRVNHLAYVDAWLEGDKETVERLEKFVGIESIQSLLDPKKILQYQAYLLLRKGTKMEDVRDALGCSLNNVGHHSKKLVERGLILPRKQGKLLSLDKQELYLNIGIKAEEGATLEELCREFDLPNYQVRRALKRVGAKAKYVRKRQGLGQTREEVLQRRRRIVVKVLETDVSLSQVGRDLGINRQNVRIALQAFGIFFPELENRRKEYRIGLFNPEPI